MPRATTLAHAAPPASYHEAPGGRALERLHAHTAVTPASCHSTVATRRRQDHSGYTRSEITVTTCISAPGLPPQEGAAPPAPNPLIRHKPNRGTCRPQGVHARLEAQVPRAIKTRSETAEKIQLKAPASLPLPAAQGGAATPAQQHEVPVVPKASLEPLKHRYFEPSRAQRMQ